MNNNIVPASSAFRKIVSGFGLSKPGDELRARISKTGKEVLQVRKNNGKIKQSITYYPSTGAVHVTQTIRNI